MTASASGGSMRGWTRNGIATLSHADLFLKELDVFEAGIGDQIWISLVSNVPLDCD
jgi:hypothetical protein